MLTFEQKMAYLAAFIDAEGWVTCRRNPAGSKLYRQIGFTNTNKALFEKIVGFAAEGGLEFGIYSPDMNNSRHAQRHNAWLLGGRSAYEKFHALVPLQHPEKVARLEAIISGYLTTEQAKRKRAIAWRESMSYERQCEIAAYAKSVQDNAVER